MKINLLVLNDHTNVDIQTTVIQWATNVCIEIAESRTIMTIIMWPSPTKQETNHMAEVFDIDLTQRLIYQKMYF